MKTEPLTLSSGLTKFGLTYSFRFFEAAVPLSEG